MVNQNTKLTKFPNLPNLPNKKSQIFISLLTPQASRETRSRAAQ
jgi:hypothetical protein